MTAIAMTGTHQGMPSGPISVNDVSGGERRLDREDRELGGDQRRHLRADVRRRAPQGGDPRGDAEVAVEHAAEHLHADARNSTRRATVPPAAWIERCQASVRATSATICSAVVAASIGSDADDSAARELVAAPGEQQDDERRAPRAIRRSRSASAVYDRALAAASTPSRLRTIARRARALQPQAREPVQFRLRGPAEADPAEDDPARARIASIARVAGGPCGMAARIGLSGGPGVEIQQRGSMHKAQSTIDVGCRGRRRRRRPGCGRHGERRTVVRIADRAVLHTTPGGRSCAPIARCGPSTARSGSCAAAARGSASRRCTPSTASWAGSARRRRGAWRRRGCWSPSTCRAPHPADARRGAAVTAPAAIGAPRSPTPTGSTSVSKRISVTPRSGYGPGFLRPDHPPPAPVAAAGQPGPAAWRDRGDPRRRRRIRGNREHRRLRPDAGGGPAAPRTVRARRHAGDHQAVDG